MIFVTLGTQDKPFSRLIEAVEKQVKLGNITEEVVVQSGCTKYKSDIIKIIDYMPMDEFNTYLNKADLIITHAGVGTIIQSLNLGKIIIAAARKQEYHEHVSNHQQQILDNFADSGYILALDNFDDLNLVIEKSRNFKPKKFKKNNEHFVSQLIDEINSLL